ncbi:hypothetical protein [Streptomyces sp. 7N604]|uniref:hypothetical protein n=1 Tax=Streptomyces sp. 7N604 TaxID=3457415 RepID=UPI003FCF6DE3
MGIESDQLVFDYLSRVGDLAQQRQLPSGERMRLVTRLRAEIDEQRAGAADTTASVKRILGRLGTPSEVVAAAGGVPADGQPEAPRHVPVAEAGREQVRETKGTVPPPRSGSEPSPPHLAGEDELGPSDATPDWWRIEPGPFGSPGESVPGFVGGIEIPEILKPPPVSADAAGGRLRKAKPDESAGGPAGGDAGGDAGAGSGEGGPGSGRGPGVLRRALSRRRPTEPVTGRSTETRARQPLSPLLLLAAGLLIVGAVLKSLVALGLGWLIAYGTRKLSRTQAKWAAVGLPGVVAAGAVVWLWGRLDGRWGEPIPQGRMGDALTETWPVALRAAAVASALYLLWRARRSPRG